MTEKYQCPKCKKTYEEGQLKWQDEDQTILLYPCGHVASKKLENSLGNRTVWACHELTLEMFKKMTGEDS